MNRMSSQEARERAEKFVRDFLPKTKLDRRETLVQELISQFLDVAEDAFQDGHQDGFDDGRQEGWDEGYAAGKEECDS